MRRTRVLIVIAILGVVTGVSVWQARDVICIDGITVPWIDDTLYAPDYSHGAFCALRVGVSSKEVVESLGRPLSIGCSYGASGDINAPRIIFTHDGEGWRVSCVYGSAPNVAGRSMKQVRQTMQVAKVELWAYSARGPSDGHYRVGVLHLADGRVIEKVGRYYFD